MRTRLLADEDLRAAILHGFRQREPQADFLSAQETIPEGLADPGVLALAADLGCVLVSHDRRTMARHFYDFLKSRESPGLILIPQLLPTRRAIEELRLAWQWLEVYEFRNQIIYLPLSNSRLRAFGRL